MGQVGYSFLSFILSISTTLICLAQPPKPADDPDIAALRPRFKVDFPFTESATNQNVAINTSKQFVTPKEDVTKKLNQTLDSVYKKNRSIKYAQGYRILVYSGTDKATINDIKQKVYRNFPDVELYTEFKAPEYRITFGDFMDKIEAHNTLVKIQNQIPSALIIQEQINLFK